MRRFTQMVLSLVGLTVLSHLPFSAFSQVPDTTQTVLYGETGVSLLKDAQVSGTVGTGSGTLSLGSGVVVTGDVYGDQAVYLNGNVRVNGNVFSGEFVLPSPDAQVTGVISEYYPHIPQETIPDLPSVPGNQLVFVQPGQTLSINAGAYGIIWAQENSTIRLTGGEIHCTYLMIDQNVEVIVEAPTTVLASQTFTFKDDALVSLSPGLEPEDFILSSSSTWSSAFEKRVLFEGIVYVPHGSLLIRKGAEVRGLFLASQIYVDDQAVIEAADAACLPAPEVCGDGIDQDCNGADLTCQEADQDGDGFTPNQGDCNDQNPQVNPNAPEVCDGSDNNCNNQTDEGVLQTFYQDQDGDQYGLQGATQTACQQPQGYASQAGDCNDQNAQINPGASELCDEQDNNCNGDADENVPNCFEGEEVPPAPENVAPPLDRTEVTPLSESVEFLYTGNNPIQTNVDIPKLDPVRVGVIRGKLILRSGDALPGVHVSIKDHSEYGNTLSRMDGSFDLVVNGGTTYVVRFEKEGYLPAERKVKVEWQDYGFAEEVALIPVDSAVTPVTLANLQEIAVARANPVQDQDGSRRATLMFEPGTTAEMVLPNGQRQALNEIHVRATEYTVGVNGPKAMPATLPAVSAYTYAVELSLDEALQSGAKTVQFNRPVIFYVENFLHFPTGENVPTGYYDIEKSAWIASNNGRIIKILSVTNGLADLDVTGNNLPADANTLAGLGITNSERVRLATLYTVGQSLWRVPIPHFSAWDHNWGINPPAVAALPQATLPAPSYIPVISDPVYECGSIIECENQGLGEKFPLHGTPYSLNYSSTRSQGFKRDHQVDLQLTGAQTQPQVKRIDLEFYVAGRVFTDTRPIQPNLTYTFNWDGKDAYGRIPQGTQKILIRVGNVYDGQYQQVPKFGVNGNGISITGDRLRREVTLWQEMERTLGHFDNAALGLGGLSLSEHHTYDPKSKTVYLGDGGFLNSDTIGRSVNVFAGTGVSGTSGDGGPALQAQIKDPISIAMDSKGNIVFADDSARIRQIDRNGIITTIAGTGRVGYSGDGGPAIQAQVIRVRGLTFDRHDNLYFTDIPTNRVRKIDKNGIITTIAGTGVLDYTGDGGPATQATFKYAVDLAIDSNDNIYVADLGNYVIRKIAPDGIITTFAGDGFPSVGAQYRDNGPATKARLCGTVDLDNNSMMVEVDDEQNVYISATACRHVRKVTPDGIIRTIAGPGQIVNNLADGQLATTSFLNGPTDIKVDNKGNLYIASSIDCRVRRVSSDGIITTIAGRNDVSCGTVNYSGNANSSVIGRPLTLALDSNDNIYLNSFSRIIKLASPFPNTSVDDVVIASKDGASLYHFDKSGRHLETLNALTGQVVYTFGYDLDGKLNSIKDGNNNITSIIRDPQQVTLVSPFGQNTVIKLDANGYTDKIINVENETVDLTLSSQGLLEDLTDARTKKTTFHYDARGRLERDEDPLGGFKKLLRSGNDNDSTVTVETALGRKDTYRLQYPTAGGRHREMVDEANLKTIADTAITLAETVTQSDGTISKKEIGKDPRFGLQAPIASLESVKLPSGLTSTSTRTRAAVLSIPGDLLSLATQTDTLVVNNHTYTQVYNAAQKQFTNTSPANRITKTTIDGQGKVVKSQVTGLEDVNYQYDLKGRLEKMSQGVNLRPYNLTYEPSGFLDSITDPLNRVVSFEYDAVGRVTKQVLPDLREINYTYDDNGNLKTITPPGRPAHTFDYSAVNLATNYLPPNVGLMAPDTIYDYNKDKQLELITRPDGRTVDFVYGAQTGRLDKITVGRGDYLYSYEPQKGTLTSITNPEGDLLSYTYDGSLLLSSTWSGAIAGSVSRTYDSNFRITSFSVNGANPINLGYDTDSLLTSAGAETITRRPANGLIDATSLGVVTTDPDYNNFGELKSELAKANGNTVYDVVYLRDDLGRIYDKTETVNGQPINHTVYTYDDAGRLKTVTLNGANPTVYDYENNGNRTKVNNQVIGTYDDQDRLVSYNGNTYTYLDNGELEAKVNNQGQTNYNYDELGNLLTVSLPNGTSIEYLIDGQNRRMGKKVNGALSQGFLYQDQLNPIAELDGNGAVVSRFVYGTKGNVPDYLIKGGVTYRIISDHLGSPRLVIDTANGNIVQQIDYDEWGKITQDTNPGFQPFGFAGGIYDQHTKLIRFGARDYDPETGRWTAKDPIKFAGRDTNLYGYVLSDPINSIDPMGTVSPGVVAVAGGVWAVTEILLSAYDGYDTATILSDPNASGWQKAVAGGLFAAGAACPGGGYSKIDDVAEGIAKWLGDDFIMISNNASDKILLSKDGTKRIRFDLNNPHPHGNPHLHVEQKVGDSWQKSGPIYPTDVPHD